jgi:hypothetical protein
MRWYNVQVGKDSHDRQVFTAYHTPREVVQCLPSSLTPIGAFGVVVLTPHAACHRVPVLGTGLRFLERLAGRSPMSRWGGFYIQAVEKSGSDSRDLQQDR